MENQSLDEIIAERKVGIGRGAGFKRNTPYKKPVVSGGVLSSSGRSLTMESDRNYSDDVYKSLDQVVAERGIIKPPTAKGKGNAGLPITGRNAKSPRLGFLDQEKKGNVSKKRKYDDILFPDDNDIGQGAVSAKRQQKGPEVLNPSRAVGYLSGLGLVVDMKIGKMVVAEEEEEEEEMNENQDHLWRCVVACGDLEVKADSSRKEVAREMACHQFMKKLREECPEVELPWSTLSGDLFIDPKVGEWVKDLALQKGLTLEFEKSVRTLDQEKRQSGDPSYVHVSTYLADGKAYHGEKLSTLCT